MSQETPKPEQLLRAHRLATGLAYDAERYEFSEAFVPAPADDPMQVHTTAEMVACLEHNPTAQLDARVLATDGRFQAIKIMERDSFVDAFKVGKYKMRESYDPFGADECGGSTSDFQPLLGGPFYKNLYFYQDYIRMHAAAFHAYHHEPFAKAIVDITLNFTLGRGFRVDSPDKRALALWRAYEVANDTQGMMEHCDRELSIYGETMLWNLPNNETKITYKLRPEEETPKGVIPRTRLVDPSNIVEIVTFPEDITRRLFYVWLAPTQYQIYTGAEAGQKTTQPTLKFIYRQIPAEQIMHFTVNSVSNEKRGRSDYFPVLGFMKRLNEAVDYELIAHQRQAAWNVDTAIEGSQSDVDAYVEAMAALGPMPPAGSDFVHTSKVIRKFLSPEAGKASSSEIFSWCASMIATGVNLPLTYFSLHLHGSQARGAALVATEPVAKKFEMRQKVLTRIVTKLWHYVMTEAGYKEVPEVEVTFPEIITQDRSSKLKDLALAQQQKWFSPERCAEIAAKELGADNYDYQDEMSKIKADPAQNLAGFPFSMPQPLTAPAKGAVGAGAQKPEDAKPQSAVSGEDKKTIKDNYGA